MIQLGKGYKVHPYFSRSDFMQLVPSGGCSDCALVICVALAFLILRLGTVAVAPSPGAAGAVVVVAVVFAARFEVACFTDVVDACVAPAHVLLLLLLHVPLLMCFFFFFFCCMRFCCMCFNGNDHDDI